MPDSPDQEISLRPYGLPAEVKGNTIGNLQPEGAV
jgi:hypothetical protein